MQVFKEISEIFPYGISHKIFNYYNDYSRPLWQIEHQKKFKRTLLEMRQSMGDIGKNMDKHSRHNLDCVYIRDGAFWSVEFMFEMSVGYIDVDVNSRRKKFD
jgi:hypothetical protein